ncbi:hypothetical protein JTB14_027742 [Gonioctena quinquepunctata]|nr:hypothetical protein JTB14_027742 [Gonioctena quinquepunctata]
MYFLLYGKQQLYKKKSTDLKDLSDKYTFNHIKNYRVLWRFNPVNSNQSVKLVIPIEEAIDGLNLGIEILNQTDVEKNIRFHMELWYDRSDMVVLYIQVRGNID